MQSYLAIVTDLHFYSTFSGLLIAQSALQHTHSQADGRGLHARCQPAHQEQFGVRYLAQGGLGNRTSNLPITEQPTPPPEPQ